MTAGRDKRTDDAQRADARFVAGKIVVNRERGRRCPHRELIPPHIAARGNPMRLAGLTDDDGFVNIGADGDGNIADDANRQHIDVVGDTRVLVVCDARRHQLHAFAADAKRRGYMNRFAK